MLFPVTDSGSPSFVSALSLEDGEIVLDHGFDFRPRWWQRPDVPPGWSAPLEDLPPARQGRGYHRISRRDLLTANQDRTPDGCGRLLLSCYVWGTGSSYPRRIGWRAKVFGETPTDVLGARLAAVRQVLDEEGPVAAYSCLHDGGRYRTKYMRASFFTKYLYAADGRGDGNHGRALILDQFVAVALNDLNDWGLPEKGGWTADVYQRWLDHAHNLARQNTDRTGALVRADTIEMAYFKHGRGIASARRAVKAESAPRGRKGDL